jgi:hypothetical protein
VNTVVCVLKSGLFKPWAAKDYTVQYGPHHVQWLRDQFAAQVRTPHRFVCMSDIEIPGVEVVPLKDNLPGWWSKLEIFREFKDAAYVDLDTVILGDVSPFLFSGRKFLISTHMTQRHGVNSSVMSWNTDMAFVYHKFMADKDRYMAEFGFSSKRWGDQDFIKEALIETNTGPIAKFQHLWPALILSYKHDIRDRGVGTRFSNRRRILLKSDWASHPHIISFHGAPKPVDVQATHNWIPNLCVA